MTSPDNIRHTLAHILAYTIKEQYPGVKLGIGPVIDTGLYYDFQFPEEAPTDAKFKQIEQRMKALIKEKLPMTGREVSADEARALFADQPFKLELIDEYEAEGRTLTAYTIGDFTDLCKGGHADNTGDVDPKSFALSHVAGAYWKGSEKNPMLTRIYVDAFDTKESLEAYKIRVEEAKKYDHRKLGRELDLFVFSELVGPGLPLFTPKGTAVRDAIDGRIWELRKAAGYERVDIPHLTKKDLYEKSGHLDKFSNELFRVNTREGHELAIKPMNCPHHTQIYARKLMSYQELPQRYANTTKVYRDEQTGELGGLTRVRSITQDDAHVFCRSSQVREEFASIVQIVKTFYGELDFALALRLSLHDPKAPEKYLGTPEVWERAETNLRAIASTSGFEVIEAPGEAALYGPKMDFMATDSLGREWQIATIQLDMNQPERFDLVCMNEQGERERVVMIHAAIAGSLERFMGILLEHTHGSLPFQYAAVQVKILTVNDTVNAYAADISEQLEKIDIRVETDNRNESIGKKIRTGELEKVPYLLVLGSKELESQTLAVRKHTEGDIGAMTLTEFLAKLT